MAILKWSVSGLAGGMIAAVLWVLTASHWETVFGYLSLPVGALAGFTVRLSSRYDQTPPTRTQSVIAVFCTAIISFIALWAIASIRADQKIQAQIDQQKIEGPKLSIDQLPVLMARDEAHQKTENGERLLWPEGKSIQTAENLDDFPAEIAENVYAQYEAMTDKERKEMILQRQKLIDQLGKKFLTEIANALQAPEVAAQLQSDILWKQLLPKNLPWLCLACLTAFWLSSETPVSKTSSSNPGEPDTDADESLQS